MPYATHVWHRLDPHKTFPRFALDAVAAALWSLSDLGILGPKTGIFDHQNSLGKNQNRLYVILKRRVFKVRQAPAGGLVFHQR